MGTIIWLSITTLGGYIIGNCWFDGATSLGAEIGFCVGIILWLLAKIGAFGDTMESLGDFGDFGGSDD